MDGVAVPVFDGLDLFWSDGEVVDLVDNGEEFEGKVFGDPIFGVGGVEEEDEEVALLVRGVIDVSQERLDAEGISVTGLDEPILGIFFNLIGELAMFSKEELVHIEVAKVGGGVDTDFVAEVFENVERDAPLFPGVAHGGPVVGKVGMENGEPGGVS